MANGSITSGPAECRAGIGGSRGAAYILALTTLLVGTVLALAMLRAAGGYFVGEDNRQTGQAALNLAEAGLDYAYWQIHYNGKTLPYSADVDLATGSFHVEATDDGARDPSMMLVTSTGRTGGRSYTTKRVMMGLLPYHYALCEKRDLSEGDTLRSTSGPRGMRSNGQIKLDSSYTNITTGAWAGTTISTRGSVSPQYPGSPPVFFPEVDLAYYMSIATRSYGESTKLVDIWLPERAGVIYVNGNLELSGTYWGVYTVVAPGDIIIKSSLRRGDSDSYLALVSPKKIRIDPIAGTVEALLYCHKPDDNGIVEVHGWTTIRGPVSGDGFTADDPVTFEYDSRINLPVMRQLRLPGLQ